MYLFYLWSPCIEVCASSRRTITSAVSIAPVTPEFNLCPVAHLRPIVPTSGVHISSQGQGGWVMESLYSRDRQTVAHQVLWGGTLYMGTAENLIVAILPTSFLVHAHHTQVTAGRSPTRLSSASPVFNSATFLPCMLPVKHLH